MGSMDNAVITGFICRLCSEISRFVIHIYGEEGTRRQLAKKINEYLPIHVSYLMYHFSLSLVLLVYWDTITLSPITLVT